MEQTEPDEDAQTRLFPEKSQDGSVISSVALTPSFLIYSTENGAIHYFLMEDWQFVNEYRHSIGIKSIHADSAGTRLVFLDKTMAAFLYNPVNDNVMPVPDFPKGAQGVVWDSSSVDRGVFVAFDENDIHTYVYNGVSVSGPSIVKLKSTPLPIGFKPLVVSDGRVECLTPGGRTTLVVLESHSHLTDDLHREGVLQAMALGRHKEAYIHALALEDAQVWKQLSEECLKRMDFEAGAFPRVGSPEPEGQSVSQNSPSILSLYVDLTCYLIDALILSLHRVP